MKILVTGGFGYLGGRLAQFLASSGVGEIRLGSRKQAESPLWLPQSSVVQTKWDSQIDLEKICVDIDVIVHLSGMNAQDCANDPISALEVNAIATSRLLNAAVNQGVRRFIYLSTAHVYASPLLGTISEHSCPINLHPYATSHRAGEYAVQYSHQRKEIEGVVIRLSNSFGAPAHKDANCWMLLVNDLCHQAVTTNRMVLRSSGKQRRDFIALSEVCRAVLHLLEVTADELGDGVFNVGGMWSPTILEMTNMVAKRVGVITGATIEIQCEEASHDERAEMLDYKIDKLLNTGFKVNNKAVVNEEIDKLIHFCLESVN